MKGFLLIRDLTLSSHFGRLVLRDSASSPRSSEISQRSRTRDNAVACIRERRKLGGPVIFVSLPRALEQVLQPISLHGLLEEQDQNDSCLVFDGTCLWKLETNSTYDALCSLEQGKSVGQFWHARVVMETLRAREIRNSDRRKKRVVMNIEHRKSSTV